MTTLKGLNNKAFKVIDVLLDSEVTEDRVKGIEMLSKLNTSLKGTTFMDDKPDHSGADNLIKDLVE